MKNAIRSLLWCAFALLAMAPAVHAQPTVDVYLSAS